MILGNSSYNAPWHLKTWSCLFGKGLSGKVGKYELETGKAWVRNCESETGGPESGKFESEIMKGLNRQLGRQDSKNRKSRQQADAISCTTRPKRLTIHISHIYYLYYTKCLGVDLPLKIDEKIFESHSWLSICLWIWFCLFSVYLSNSQFWLWMTRVCVVSDSPHPVFDLYFLTRK